jgi:hypothetical protein
MKRSASSIDSTIKSNSMSIRESIEKSNPKSAKEDIDDYEKMKLKYIDIIENKFIKKIPDDIKEEIDWFIHGLNFKNNPKYFDYGIMSYIKILNIIYLFKNKSKIVSEYIFKYDFYAERYYIDVVIYFIELIQLNVLFVEENNKSYYLSPLNDNNFRLYMRKYYKISEFDYTYKKLQKAIKNNRTKYTSNEFDVKDYDFILMNSYYGGFPLNRFEIELKNFDINRDYNSCVLHSKERTDSNHVISLQKCNNTNIINTTWNRYNNKKIDDFIPLEDKNYILNDNIKYSSYKNAKFRSTPLSFRKSKKYDKYTYIFNTKLVSQYEMPKHHVIYKNMYFFTNKSNISKEYKTINGGVYDITDKNCINIFNIVNDSGFCWFSGIVSALCYSDKTAKIIYKKSERFIKKSINFIRDFLINSEYKTLDLRNDKVLKTLHKNYIYLFLFIHSSYYLLMTNKINNLDLAKFGKKMDLINNNFKKIFLYVSIIEYYSLYYDLPESYMELWN